MTRRSDGRRSLPFSNECFVCGERNQAGLRAKFFVEDGTVVTRWRAGAKHCGLDGVVHGGVVASILDECMAWAASRVLGRLCVTAELTIRYLQRVPGGAEIAVRARVDRPGKRIVVVSAQLQNEAGNTLAEAAGKFVPISVEETLAIDDALVYREGDERPFEALRAPSACEAREE